MKMSRRFLTALLSLSLAGAVQAEVRLPAIFGDHMVLQRDTKIPIWGRANPGEEVTVTLGPASASTETGTDGKWRVDLENLPASREPAVLIVKGTNELRFEDVLVGDVWICSGQSNMEFGVGNVNRDEPVDPEVRVFHVTKAASLEPLDDIEQISPELNAGAALSGHWQKTWRPGTWGGFSAVGYLFAKKIHELTNEPVGIIGAYWGGTPAQAWMSHSGLEGDPATKVYAQSLGKLSPEQLKKFPVRWGDYVAAMRQWDKEVWSVHGKALAQWKKDVEAAKTAGQPEPPKPEPSRPQPPNPGNVGTATSLYNGMIHPLIPFAIKGVIWYQGEANSNGGAAYGPLFKALITDWRTKWGQGDFPFLFVQVAGYGVPITDPSRGRWAGLREGQSKGLELPNTGMATAVDIGEEKDIHPKNKVDVARRLALIAGQLVYGKDQVAIGPVYESAAVEGNGIRVHFKSIGGGLKIGSPPVMPGKEAKPIPAELTGFEIAGADQVWHPAKAVIDGQTVVVSSEAVPSPVAVRYAWADFPACSLYNGEGLPAFPFRTDSWKP